MNRQILSLANELSGRGERFVLAHIVRRDAPSSARVGDVALVTADGGFHGWLGGSCTRPAVIREALRALVDGRPRLIGLTPDSSEPAAGKTVYPMTCHSGGRVDIYIEPVLPVPRLTVFGVSPLSRALARVGNAAGYAVDVIAPGAHASEVPEANRVLDRPEPRQGNEQVCAIVATFGDSDEAAVRDALQLEPAYLGVVASPARFRHLRETLLAGGASATLLDRIKSPAGLDIGAESPEEIALSILAEIVRDTRQAAGEIRQTRGETGQHAEVLDPVCGMTVIASSTTASAEFEGQAYYFCCTGCRERFVSDPARFAGASAAGGET